MPEAFATALSFPGFWWLAIATFVAGLVRGFSGFGTGIIYLPLAAQVLPPVWAITTIIVFDLFGPAIALPKVLPDVVPGDLARLFAGTLVGLPIGLAALFYFPPEVFRYAISVIALVLVTGLIAGLRYRGPFTPPIMLGTGGLSGLFGGAAGAPGPPVIFLYLGGVAPPAVVRAHNTVFLLGYDLLVILMFVIAARLEAVPVWLGLLLVIPNALGNLCGNALFRPEKEKLYRYVAYLVIIFAALSGLPIWET